MSGSRIDLKNQDDSRVRNTGHPQGQCSPVPLPPLGTQRIIQGNGTNVGTVISLQCPAKHRLVGKGLTCVMVTNSAQWVGQTYCQRLSFSEDYGFRVAILASIVSSGIILLLSVAFITSCLLDCVKEDKRKKPERESDALQWEEQQWEDNRSPHSHKGRNNNNNNNQAQEKLLPLWDAADPVLWDDVRPCRCLQQYAHRPPPSLLPGLDFNQPLSPRNLDSCPPEYPGPPQSACRTTSSGLAHVSAAGTGLLWQYGGQRCGSSKQNPPILDESNMRNIKSNKEISIRIITV